LERKALRKNEKYQKKVRKAANLDFQGLLNLAQNQKPSSDSSGKFAKEQFCISTFLKFNKVRILKANLSKIPSVYYLLLI